MDAVSSFGAVRSVKVVPNSPLVCGRADMGAEGDFYAVRLKANAPEIIGFFDLGNTWAFLWMDADDIANL